MQERSCLSGSAIARAGPLLTALASGHVPSTPRPSQARQLPPQAHRGRAGVWAAVGGVWGQDPTSHSMLSVSSSVNGYGASTRPHQGSRRSCGQEQEDT